MPSIPDSKSSVSILVCSKDRRSSLETLVASIKGSQSAVAPQIVVVEETDHPKPIEGTTYIAHPMAHRGIPFARNLALANATGQIVVFVDDDCVSSNDWLERLIGPIREDRTVVGAQGGVTVPEHSNAIGWAESLLGFPGGGITRVLQAMGNTQRTREVSTLNCAYRHSVIEKIGGFEPALRLGGEDFLLAKRACSYGACVFVPDALVFHEPRGTLGSIWKWFVRRGRAEVDVLRTGQQNDITVWSMMLSAFLVKLLLLITAGAVLPNGIVLVAVVLCILYPGVQYYRYYRWWQKSPAPLSALIVLPVVKYVMDVAMDVGRIRGFVFDR